jgi:hypothetical protein
MSRDDVERKEDFGWREWTGRTGFEWLTGCGLTLRRGMGRIGGAPSLHDFSWLSWLPGSWLSGSWLPLPLSPRPQSH